MADRTLTFAVNLPAKRCAAGVLFHDGRGRILLVQPTYKPYWDLPGGIVERNESPATAAAREVKEELGLIVQLRRLLVVDWFAPVPGQISEALMFVFDGGHLSAQEADDIRLQSDELRSWAWSTPEETAERIAHAPKLLARVRAAFHARTFGYTAYTDGGA